MSQGRSQKNTAAGNDADSAAAEAIGESILLVGNVELWSPEVQSQVESSSKAARIRPCPDDAAIRNALSDTDISMIFLQVRNQEELLRCFSVLSLAREPLRHGLSVLILVTTLPSHPQIEMLEKKGLVQILKPNTQAKAVRIKVEYSLSRMRASMKKLIRQRADLVIRTKSTAPILDGLELIAGDKAPPAASDVLFGDDTELNEWNDKRKPDAPAKAWGNRLGEGDRDFSSSIDAGSEGDPQADQSIGRPNYLGPAKRVENLEAENRFAQLGNENALRKSFEIVPVENQNEHLVLISQREQDLRLVNSVCKSLNSNFHVFCRPSSDILQFLARYPQSMILWDVDHENAGDHRKEGSAENVGLMLSRIGKPTQVFAISDYAAVRIPYLTNIGRQVFTHNLLRRQSETAIEIYTRLIEATLSHRALGLEQYFRGGSRRQEIKLSTAAQRGAAIGAVRNFLSRQGLSPRLSTQVSNSLEELLLNALFCAPVTPEGERYRTHDSRTDDFDLSSREKVSVAVMSNDDYFGVSVTDRFGSLDLDRVLQNLQHDFRAQGYAPESGKVAGLGLNKVLESGFSLLMVLDPGRATEVTIFFPKAKNHRDFRTRFHFLSAIWISD